jgi:hypothetical protein
MKINKLEVKNISYYARGSEETPCYNATVYINGKKAIEVSNEGRGGSDMQHTYPNIEERGLVQQADEWCIKTYGKKTHKYMSNGEEKSFEIEMDLEHVCQDALYDWLDKKSLKKDMQKKYLFVEKGQLMAYKRIANDTETSFKDFFKKNHPTSKCLNFLSFDDALKLYRECA